MSPFEPDDELAAYSPFEPTINFGRSYRRPAVSAGSTLFGIVSGAIGTRSGEREWSDSLLFSFGEALRKEKRRDRHRLSRVVVRRPFVV